MLNIGKHRAILIQILKEIYSDIEISSLLGFKGGTAVYFFYKLPRFSVDLDFNLLDEEKEDFIYNKIKKLLSQFGDLKESINKRSTIFFILSYEGGERNLKVEISKSTFKDSYELKNYLGISMLVMKQADMFAHKLAALLDRESIANRDLFDIRFFMQERWAVNKELLEQRLESDLRSYIDECIKAINQLNNTYILQGLGDLLDENVKNQMKAILKKDVIFYLNEFKDHPIVA